VDIAADDLFAKYGNVSKPGRRQKSRHENDEGGSEVYFMPHPLPPLFFAYHLQTILDSKSSRRIFELARDQQDELDRQDPEEEDEDVIENDFTRPRTRDLELVDEEDEDEEERFGGFSGDEERELVRAFLLDRTLFFSADSTWAPSRKSMRAIFRHSTSFTRPMPSNERLSRTSYSPSWRVAEVRPLSSKLRVDVSQFHFCIR
jgi:hypothetical protein